MDRGEPLPEIVPRLLAVEIVRKDLQRERFGRPRLANEEDRDTIEDLRTTDAPSDDWPAHREVVVRTHTVITNRFSLSASFIAMPDSTSMREHHRSWAACTISLNEKSGCLHLLPVHSAAPLRKHELSKSRPSSCFSVQPTVSHKETRCSALPWR